VVKRYYVLGYIAGLNGVTSQKRELLIATFARTSDPDERI
jgi:hypothetical protein